MAISAQQLTIYLYSAHRAVIFAIAQLSCITRVRYINLRFTYLLTYLLLLSCAIVTLRYVKLQ